MTEPTVSSFPERVAQPGQSGPSTFYSAEFGGTYKFEVWWFVDTTGAMHDVWAKLPHQCDQWDIGDARAMAVFVAEAKVVAEWMDAQGLVSSDEAVS